MTTLSDIITAAIDRERVIRFWYASSVLAAPVIRTVSPYELSDDGETVLGFDHTRQALRRFSLDRIVTDDIELPDNEDYVYPIEKEEV